MKFQICYACFGWNSWRTVAK